MGTIGTVLKLALAKEDAFGRVLAGSTGRGIRTLVKDAKAAKLAGEGGIFKNFAKLANTEVDTFTKLGENIDKLNIDKATLKSLKKSSGNMKTFWKNMQRVIDGEDVSKVFTKASAETTEALAKKMVKGGADDLIEATAETAAKKGIFAKAGEAITKKIPALGKLKGKGGTIGILLSLAFEIPSIIQAFKNGDGPQQIGRSALNLGGAAAGAAAGAAIGSIIPGAGTVIGGIIGGALGFVGSIFGADLSKKAGDAIFGKSIQDQKDEAAAAQEAAYADQTVATEGQPATSYTSTGNTSIPSDFSSTATPKYTYGFKPVLDVKA